MLDCWAEEQDAAAGACGKTLSRLRPRNWQPHLQRYPAEATPPGWQPAEPLKGKLGSNEAKSRLQRHLSAVINGDNKGKDKLARPPQKPSSLPDGERKAEKTLVKRPREPSGSLNGGHNGKKTASAYAGGPISEAGPSSAPQARAYPGVQTIPTPNSTWLAGGIGSEHPHPPPLTNGRRSANGGKISCRPSPPLWNNGRPTNGGPVDRTSPPPPPAEHDHKQKGSSSVDRRGPAKPGGPNGTFELVLRGGGMMFKTARRGFSHIGSNAIRRANSSRAHYRNPSEFVSRCSLNDQPSRASSH